MKYFIYVRRSSDREDRQTLSIDAQSRDMKELATRDSLNVIDVFSESHSAYKPGRPAFEEMLERIELGQAQGIITWQASRLARNALDGGRIIHLMDQKKLLEVRTKDKLFTNSGNDKFFLQIEFGMAKKSSDDTSDYMKRDAKSKLLKGEWPGMAPVGYVNVDKDGKIAGKFFDLKKQNLLGELDRELNRVEVDPVVGPLLRKFFDFYLSDQRTLAESVAFINALGVKSHRLKGNFSKSMVDRILRNPFFAGMLRYEGELYEGKHEPLIALEEFEEVQRRLSERKRPKNVTHEFVYRGLIKCSECGCSIVGVRKENKNGNDPYEYYTCSKRRGPCNQQPLKPQKIHVQVEEKLKDIHIDVRVWELCKKLLRIYYADRADKAQDIQKSLQINLNDVEKKLDRLLDLHISGGLNKDEYVSKKTTLLQERGKMQSQIEHATYTNDEARSQTESFFGLAHAAYKKFSTGTADEKKWVVQQIGWKLALGDGTLQWEYKKPFDMLVKQQKGFVSVGNSIRGQAKTKIGLAHAEVDFWRTGRDSNHSGRPVCLLANFSKDV